MKNDKTNAMRYVQDLIEHNSNVRKLYFSRPRDSNGGKVNIIQLTDVNDKLIINDLEFKIKLGQDLEEDTREDGEDRFILQFSFNLGDITFGLYYFQELHKEYGHKRPVYVEVEEEYKEHYIKTKGLNHVDPLFKTADNKTLGYGADFDILRHAVVTSNQPFFIFSYHSKKFINFAMSITNYFPGKLTVHSKRLDTAEGLKKYSSIAINSIEGISYELKGEHRIKR